MLAENYTASVYKIEADSSKAKHKKNTFSGILSVYFVAEDVITGETASLPRISAPELAERKKANGLVIVDVRGKSEYDEQHIEGAIHIPLTELTQNLDLLPDLEPAGGEHELPRALVELAPAEVVAHREPGGLTPRVAVEEHREPGPGRGAGSRL